MPDPAQRHLRPRLDNRLRRVLVTHPLPTAPRSRPANRGSERSGSSRGARPAGAGTGIPPSSARLQSERYFCHGRRLPELILSLQETPPQSDLGRAAPWQTVRREPKEDGPSALTAASAPVGIGFGVSPRGPRAPHNRVHTGHFSGKEKRRFWPLRTGPYWGSSPFSGTLGQGPEGRWAARCPSGALEVCSLLNGFLSCFVHTPCPAGGCGCPHAGAPPHRGRVGDTEGTWGRQMHV